MRKLILATVIVITFATLQAWAQSCQKCDKLTGDGIGCVDKIFGQDSTTSSSVKAMLEQAKAKSMAELWDVWSGWTKARGLADAISPYSPVLSTLVKSEQHVLAKHPCVSNGRAGAFSLVDFLHPKANDPSADWEASIDVEKRMIVYDITDQPDKKMPDRLVITNDEWRIYQGDHTGGHTLVAKGTLGG